MDGGVHPTIALVGRRDPRSDGVDYVVSAIRLLRMGGNCISIGIYLIVLMPTYS